jgi:mono/diheme cytochrome c family protein
VVDDEYREFERFEMTRLRELTPLVLFLAFVLAICLGMVLSATQATADPVVTGKELFEKKDLGPAGKSCADCHTKDKPLTWNMRPENTAKMVVSCHKNCQGAETALSPEAAQLLAAHVETLRKARYAALLKTGTKLAGSKTLGSNDKSCSSCHPGDKKIGWDLDEAGIRAGIEMCHTNCIEAEDPLAKADLENLTVWATAQSRTTRAALEEQGKALFSDTSLGTVEKSCASCHPSQKKFDAEIDRDGAEAGIAMCVTSCLECEDDLDAEKLEALLVHVMKFARASK